MSEDKYKTTKLILGDCIGLEVLLKPDDKIVMLAPKHPWAYEVRAPLCAQHQTMYERYQKAGMGLNVASCMGIKDQVEQHYYWRKEPAYVDVKTGMVSHGLCVPCYTVTVQNMEAQARLHEKPRDPLEGII